MFRFQQLYRHYPMPPLRLFPLLFCLSLNVSQAAHAEKPNELNLASMLHLDTDTSAALQAAIDSGAKRVVIPYRKEPYIVEPIFLRSSDQEIFLEPGVEIRAKSGKAFSSIYASLLVMRNVRNVTIRGEGATLRMNRAEYPRKPHSEWRHGLKIEGCENILVEGLTIRETGGDGVYISYLPENVSPVAESSGKPAVIQSRNVTIRNVHAIANYRQGLSLISGENILIEDCVFEKTIGAPPQAGVDIEPGNDLCILKNIVVKNCISRNNAGSGFMVYLAHLRKSSPPVSIRFENCLVEKGQWGLIAAAVGEDDAVEGTVLFENCVVKETDRAGIYVYDKAALGATFVFKDCVLESVANRELKEAATPDEAASPAPLARRPPPQAPIVFYHRRVPTLPRVDTFGGVHFENVKVNEWRECPLIMVGAASGEDHLQLRDIRGELILRDGEKRDVMKLLPRKAMH